MPLIGQTVTTAAGRIRFPSNGKIPSDYGMFQPRFGLAWDVNGDGKSVLRLSAGQYFARVAALNLASVRNNNGSVGQTIFRNTISLEEAYSGHLTKLPVAMPVSRQDN